MTRKLIPGLLITGFLLAQSPVTIADTGAMKLSDSALQAINAGGLSIVSNASSAGLLAIAYGETHAASYGLGAIGAGASIACCGSSSTKVTGNGDSILNINIPIGFIGASVSIGINHKPKKRRSRRR